MQLNGFHDMAKEERYFIYLLAAAFVLQLIIDLGSFFGAFYELYPNESLDFAGFGAILSFRDANLVSMLGSFFYYISIVGMLLATKLSRFLLIASLIFAVTNIVGNGIYIGTPVVDILGMFAWSAYIAGITMFFMSGPTKISAKRRR